MGEKGRLFTGARARFILNGKVVGYARNVAVTEEIQYDPVEVLDNIEVEEYVPVAYRVRFTASMFRIIAADGSGSMKAQGWFPATGGNTGEHLENILVSGDMWAQIEDTKTGETFAMLEQVKVASHNWTIDARGIVGEDMEFVAVRMKDESEA